MAVKAEVLEALLEQGGIVAEYAKARQNGLTPVERIICWSEGRFEGTLMLRDSSGAEERLSSAEEPFLRLVLDHVWTMGAAGGVPLRSELSIDEPQPSGALSVEVSCGLFRVTQAELTSLILTERSTEQDSSRTYELRLPVDQAKLLSPVPSGPQLRVRLLRGSNPVFALNGHIDVVATVKPEEEILIHLAGGDALTGTRVHIAAAYNCRVNPCVPVLGFAPYLEPAVLDQPVERPALFLPLQPYLSAPVLPGDLGTFLEAITAVASSLGEEVQGLAESFCDNLSEDHPFLAMAGAAFVNLATVLMHDLPTLFMAVGSVRGVRTAGVVRISPGVVIAAADHMPMRLEGREDELLCRHWDPTAAYLVTFFLADSAPDTRPKGWAALSDAFDLLSLALSDAGWLHADGAGAVTPMLLDGRAQDASLELDQHYHVNEVLSGLAHQYHAGVLLASSELTLNDFAVDSFRQRLDPLSRIFRFAEADSPRLVRQLRHAVSWISRSRRSTTDSERFLCLWIAIEFLLVASAPDAGVIKDAVSGGVSRIMSQGDRTARRYWRGIAEEAYDLRNELVHEAQEDPDKLKRLTPLIQQAVFEIVWTCALAANAEKRDGHPSEFLPR